MTGSRGRLPAGGSDRGIATVRTIAVALAVLAASVGGAFALGVLGAPSVVEVDNEFGNVTDERTTIRTDLVVNNPNPIGVQLSGVTADYTVSMNGIEMANGTKRGVTVERGNFTVPLSTALDNERIPAWWVSHVSNGEHTDLTVNATVTSSLVGRSYSTAFGREIDTSIVEAFRTTERQPVNAGAPLVSDPVLYLERTEAEWGTVNRSTTRVEMTLYLHNPKEYPITVSRVGYDVRMNGVEMGSGEAGRSTTIPPGETVAMDATTAIHTQRLDEWWVSHLNRNQVTNLTMPFYLVVDLSAVGAGERRIRLDSYRRTVETDVFGDKGPGGANASDSTGDGSPSADGTATATPAGEGTATSTPAGDASATGTAAATPDGTGTPDGTAAADDTATPTPTPDGASGSDGSGRSTATRTPTATPDGTTTDDGLLAVAPDRATVPR